MQVAGSGIMVTHRAGGAISGVRFSPPRPKKVMTAHLNIKIYGNVVGVFFRQSAKEQADNLGITGFAQNESDDTVYIEAEGEEKNLDKFLAWCKKGPELAKVEKVESFTTPLKNFTEFLIR